MKINIKKEGENMGTRNLTMVIDRKGELKVAQYGQWDGYPSGNGVEILEFCKNKTNLQKLEQMLDKVKFFNKENADENIKAFIEEYTKREPYYNFETKGEQKDTRTEQDIFWFENFISRDVGANILSAIIDFYKEENYKNLPIEHNNFIYLRDESDFGKDSLMCEWAYCINLQTNKLECFEGFNTNKELEHERFITDQKEVDERFNYTNKRYYGIRLIKEYDLDNLPTEEDFISELENFELKRRK